jgi:ABC-type phosphate/phosphonate transport system substrate-binding protein
LAKGLCLAFLLAVSLIGAPVQAESAEDPSLQEMPSISLGSMAWIPAEAFRNRMAPLSAYLEGVLPFSVRLVIVDDAHSFYNAVAAGAFDLAYVDGCYASRGIAQGHLRPLVEIEIGELRSLVIVKEESNLKKASDLVGRSILVPMDTQAFATRLGLLAIAEELGKRPDNSFELRVASDNGQVIFDVLEGRADVGIIHDVAFAALAEPLQASLRVLATSEPGPNTYLVSRADLSPEIAEQVSEAWLGFEKDAAAAAYFSSTIRQFRDVDAAQLKLLGAFCDRIDKESTPLMAPQPLRREGE